MSVYLFIATKLYVFCINSNFHATNCMCKVVEILVDDKDNYYSHQVAGSVMEHGFSVISVFTMFSVVVACFASLNFLKCGLGSIGVQDLADSADSLDSLDSADSLTCPEMSLQSSKQKTGLK